MKFKDTALPEFKHTVLPRGYKLIEFNDANGHLCEIQESSAAQEDFIWLGLGDLKPQIRAKDTPEGGNGWRDYPLPDNVHVLARMHLSKEHAKKLIPILKHFVKTGYLPEGVGSE